ncbi:bifunctional riboflavin kinase/FAD synthetase [Ahrensia kielensis]|uniref:bifunctional riboflavin kinase/FAD synthetase n=1 Tax=Ahrensia kielensis TaxID=76980 RepID=UPI0003755165|nr:bifunctional riboflavin kinase/FAD synthetase [Ahrensia kielensis]
MADFARIQDLMDFPKGLRGGVIAIGNFDGLHRGHQAVLKTAFNLAQQMNVPALVLTFEPHPRSFFQSKMKLSRITPPRMKARIVEKIGFGAIVELPFTKEFSEQTADVFINDILVGRLGAKAVVTGFDFHFGKDRQGDPAYLMQAGETNGFQVKLVDAQRDQTSDIISSSRIRHELAEGNVAAANDLLGYRYRVTSPIIAGEQLGRTLGYPTANMALPAETPLAHGIYAVRFHRQDGTIFDGVASFGRRPTVTEKGAPLLETYVFDFKGDLYDENCTVSLIDFLRGEEKFLGLDPLIEQMKIDEKNAREILSGLEPISELDAQLTFGRDGA